MHREAFCQKLLDTALGTSIHKARKKCLLRFIGETTTNMGVIKGVNSFIHLARMVNRHEPHLLDWNRFIKILLLLKQQ